MVFWAVIHPQSDIFSYYLKQLKCIKQNHFYTIYGWYFSHGCFWLSSLSSSLNQCHALILFNQQFVWLCCKLITIFFFCTPVSSHRGRISAPLIFKQYWNKIVAFALLQCLKTTITFWETSINSCNFRVLCREHLIQLNRLSSSELGIC